MPITKKFLFHPGDFKVYLDIVNRLHAIAVEVYLPFTLTSIDYLHSDFNALINSVARRTPVAQEFIRLSVVYKEFLTGPSLLKKLLFGCLVMLDTKLISREELESQYKFHQEFTEEDTKDEINIFAVIIHTYAHRMRCKRSGESALLVHDGNNFSCNYHHCTSIHNAKPFCVHYSNFGTCSTLCQMSHECLLCRLFPNIGKMCGSHSLRGGDTRVLRCRRLERLGMIFKYSRCEIENPFIPTSPIVLYKDPIAFLYETFLPFYVYRTEFLEFKRRQYIFPPHLGNGNTQTFYPRLESIASEVENKPLSPSPYMNRSKKKSNAKKTRPVTKK